MGTIFYFIVFLFGLFVGSFLNCVIYRLETGGSFLKGRSYCPYCKRTLGWQDLIPILSFLILKGKCRYCQKKISWQYPLVEIATGLVFVLVLNYEATLWGVPFGSRGVMNHEFFNFGSILYSLFFILTSCFLIIIFVYDLKRYIIPDKVIYPAIAVVFLYNLVLNSKFFWTPSGGLPGGLLLNSLIAAFGAAGFFLFIVLISKGRWMGLGDVKLAFFMGLLLSFPNILVALFFAFLIGATIGIGLILAKRKTLKSEVPFGPFLVTGTFIAMFFGENLINWYLNLFNLNF